jgi:hypothetical protein
MPPWDWRPSLAPWLLQLCGAALKWRPEGLPADQADIVRSALLSACNSAAPWLYHPFICALTADGDSDCRPSDLQLVAWVALNCPDLNVVLDVRRPETLLSWQGEDVKIEGRISSSGLASRIRGPDCNNPARAGEHGAPILTRSASMLKGASADRGRFDAYTSGIDRIFSSIPIVGSWISETAKMAELLPLPADGSFASSSSPDMPGLIRLSMSGDLMQLLEAIVHETAHLYLFRFEAGASLVKHGCTMMLASPLRTDPRPLRGVLLAMHACAYISAAFAEAGIASLEDPRRCRAQKCETLELFDQARRALDPAREFLTDAGLGFVDKAVRVANFARAQ